jgi:hypothetical protein
MTKNKVRVVQKNKSVQKQNPDVFHLSNGATSSAMTCVGCEGKIPNGVPWVQLRKQASGGWELIRTHAHISAVRTESPDTVVLEVEQYGAQYGEHVACLKCAFDLKELQLTILCPRGPWHFVEERDKWLEFKNSLPVQPGCSR